MKKTITKAAEAPIAIITIAKIAAFIFSKNGIEIPEDLIYEGTIALYGTFKGFQNWIKNRRK
jgi:hypothetical protein